jgi:hypothetical protein
MAFTLDGFVRSRPFLYHLTHAENLARIRRTRVLESAERLLQAAGRDDLITTRRRRHERVEVRGDVVHVRDQAPLHAGNMSLEPGWTFADFVRQLNARVFFWPGSDLGPIAYGRRHYAKYAAERPAIIRVPTGSLLSVNPDVALLFCKFNSGSPRWTRGRASPRNSGTFVSASTAPFSASAVVEATAVDAVRLPDETGLGENPDGPWIPLFTSAGNSPS